MTHTTLISSNDIVIIIAVIAIITASTVGWYSAISIENNHDNFPIAFDDRHFDNTIKTNGL